MSSAIAIHPLTPDVPAIWRLPPVHTRFRLGPTITAEQESFLDSYGFLIFEKVASPEELGAILEEADRLEAEWVREARRSVRGIPLYLGVGPRGGPMIQRLPFTSMYSRTIHRFVREPRFEPVRALIGAGARIGDEEKDGVVLNRYLNVPGSAYPRLGWHTDGLRDLFYLRMPKRMLNVGLHFDRSTKDNGGLRVIPGSHRQGFFGMCFHKPYFVSHAPDPFEVAIETEPGDLTVHDGRMWHRVAPSPSYGLASLRRTMFVPYLTDAYAPKDERAQTPIYHHLGQFMRRRWLKRWL
ncbi:MAG: phytanoyl-CoA dioxygenase family protein [Myxococcota bacterium]